MGVPLVFGLVTPARNGQGFEEREVFEGARIF
jgi:hypothetical protein